MPWPEFPKPERETLDTITIIQSSSAIIASCFVIFSYLRFKPLRKRSLELVCWLAVSSCGSNTAYALTPALRLRDNRKALCAFQGVVMQFFDFASIMWALIIAYSLWSAISRSKIIGRRTCHAIAWCSAVVMTVLPATTNSYGVAGNWCWIKNTGTGIAWRYIAFYGPLWAVILASLILYTSSVRAIKEMVNIASSGNAPVATKSLLRVANSMRYYPLLFVVAWAGMTVSRIRDTIIKDQSTTYENALVQTLVKGSFYQAILNALAYGCMNSSVRFQWTKLVAEIKDTRSCKPLCYEYESLDFMMEDDLQDPDEALSSSNVDFGDTATEPDCRRPTQEMV